MFYFCSDQGEMFTWGIGETLSLGLGDGGYTDKISGKYVEPHKVECDLKFKRLARFQFATITHIYRK